MSFSLSAQDNLVCRQLWPSEDENAAEKAPSGGYAIILAQRKAAQAAQAAAEPTVQPTVQPTTTPSTPPYPQSHVRPPRTSNPFLTTNSNQRTSDTITPEGSQTQEEDDEAAI